MAKNTLAVLTLYYILQNLYRKNNNILKKTFKHEHSLLYSESEHFHNLLGNIWVCVFVWDIVRVSLYVCVEWGCLSLTTWKLAWIMDLPLRGETDISTPGWIVVETPNSLARSTSCTRNAWQKKILQSPQHWKSWVRQYAYNFKWHSDSQVSGV